jgi:flagellar protein FlgJ
MAGGIKGINGPAMIDNAYVPFSGAPLSREEPREEFARIMEQAREQIRQEEPRSIPKDVVIDKKDKLYEQCEALETFLVKNILSGMRKNVMKSNLLDTGMAGEIYEDMLWDEYAKEYTRSSGFGLAELAYLELTGQRGKVISHS